MKTEHFSVKFDEKELKIKLKDGSCEKTFIPLQEYLSENITEFENLETITLNFKHIESFETGGFNLFYGLIKESEKHSIKLCFTNLNKKLNEIFISMNFNKFADLQY